MTRNKFEKIVAEEFPRAVPEKFMNRIKNVAFVVESELSSLLRREQGLKSNETLLGFYHGVPATHRGDNYGVGPIAPDKIVLFQKPIEEVSGGSEGTLRRVVRDTIWHEVAHYFGFSEEGVRRREKGLN